MGRCVRVGVLVWAGAMGAAGQTGRDLAELSLDELANIEVTSVAKKQQKLSRVPAAVFVLTAEDIRRSGATSIPEVLRLVPGVQVARMSRHEWAISVRGFNGRWSNKLLVMVDGRTVYMPSFSGVHWDVQDTLLDDIERIEVIRGPGATMWGANAVNGIINIITRTAGDTHGGFLEAASGDPEHATAGLRYGVRLGDRGWGRVYGKYFTRDGGWHSSRGGFRGDWELSARDSLTVQGDVFTSRTDVEVDSVLFDRYVKRSDGGNLLGRWKRTYSEQASTQLQVYYDYYHRDDLLAPESVSTFDLEFQQHNAAGAHDLIWGGTMRFSRSRVDPAPLVSFTRSERDIWRSGGFLQDEIGLVRDRLNLTVGSKIEHNTLGGLAVQPSAQLAWTPGAHHTLWASVGRAVRDPSQYEQEVHVTEVAGLLPGVSIEILGNRAIQPESMVAAEAGARWQPSPRISFDLAGFHNSYRDLQSIEVGAPRPDLLPRILLPVQFGNGLEGRTYGAELAASFQPAPRWRLMAGYSWLRMRLHRKPGSTALFAAELGGESPEHQGTLRSWLDLSRTVAFDATLYLTDRLPAQNVPGRARVDARLAWRPVKSLELSLVGQNLGDRRVVEFVPLQDRVFDSSALGRAAYLRLAWRF